MTTIADLLAGVADGSPLLDRGARRHVESCLRCQADLVQYRKLLRALHHLRTEVLEPAPGLLPEILATLEAAGERHALRSMLTGRRLAYAGGIAAAPPPPGPPGALLLATRGKRLPAAASRVQATRIRACAPGCQLPDEVSAGDAGRIDELEALVGRSSAGAR